MALFESYERRIKQIDAVLNKYGIASIEEAKKIVKEDELYLHTTKNNKASLKVMLNNGAYIKEETAVDYFVRIKIK